MLLVNQSQIGLLRILHSRVESVRTPHFCEIGKNWAGWPLESSELIANDIKTTTTRTWPGGWAIWVTGTDIKTCDEQTAGPQPGQEPTPVTAEPSHCANGE